jgi:ABC-2 type transport system permease protein
MLVLFNYVFSGAIGVGLGGVAHGGSYINYLAPDIITRFRTMAISRASVLTGQVLGSLIRTMISVSLLLLVALLMGFRPTADPLSWTLALGLTALFA